MILLALAGCVEESTPAAEGEQDGMVVDAMLADAELEPDMTVDAEVPPVIDAGLQLCQTAEDCPAGAECEDGRCTQPDCTEGGDECGNLQGCLEGTCVDRCFGEGTCFRGGICVDGICHPPECEADADCGDDLLCRDDRCVEAEPCAEAADCGEDQRCVEGNCEAHPPCGGDRNCGPQEICDEGLCRPREGCEARDECAEAEDCVGGRCVPFVCRGDVDCAEAELCRGGVCVDPPEVMVEQVVILNGPRTLTVGQSLRYRAVGLDARGDIVASNGFTWTLNNEDVAVIDAMGVLTAGPGTGDAQLVAHLGDLSSDPVALTVLELVQPEGWRVRVTSQSTGLPLAGAMVRVGMASAESDAAGIAELSADAEGPLTVFANDHDYVSVVGLEPGAVHVPLPDRSDLSRVAGFTGEIDFARVLSEGGVEMGLAGASIGGGLSNIDMSTLLGELFSVEVGAFGFNIDLPLPGGLIMSAELPVVGPLTIKDDFKVTSLPGFQFGWSFAGRIDTNAIIQLFSGGGGNFDVGSVLNTLLPFFDQFQHGLRVADDLRALPRVIDEDDVDGDGDVEELVPDYSRFDTLNNRPEQDQRLRLAVGVPALPAGEGTAVALLFAGVDVESVGFVPLGVSSTDAAEQVSMRMAAPYAGLEVGAPTVMALAARFGDGANLPENISVLMRRWADELPANVDLGEAFLALPEAADWDAPLRTFGGAGVEAASVHRVQFAGPAGGWTVWFAAGADPAMTLPFPPEGFSDLAAATRVRFDALLLEGAELRALVGEGGAGGLSDVDRFTTGFSRLVP
jgi:hypothetical protein